jgi:hypothetical protein
MKKIAGFLLASVMMATTSTAQLYSADAESATELTTWTITPSLSQSATGFLAGTKSYRSSGFNTTKTYTLKSPGFTFAAPGTFVAATGQCKYKIALGTGIGWTANIKIKNENTSTETTLYTTSGTGSTAGSFSNLYYPNDNGTSHTVGHVYTILFEFIPGTSSTNPSYILQVDDLLAGDPGILGGSSTSKYPALTLSGLHYYKLETSSGYTTYADLNIAKPAQASPYPSDFDAVITINKIDKTTGEIVANEYIVPSITGSPSANSNSQGLQVIDETSYSYSFVLSQYYDASGYIVTLTSGLSSPPSNIPSLVSRSENPSNPNDPPDYTSEDLYKITSGGTVYYYLDVDMTTAFNGGNNWYTINPYYNVGTSAVYFSRIDAYGVEAEIAFPM